MARANFVKKARKDYPEAGISKGDSYYWWQFRFGGKFKSKTQPKPSQLTQSEFLGGLYGISESLEILNTEMSIEDIKDAVSTAVDELRGLADEQGEKRENMPYQLQDSGSGELLESRNDMTNEMADELENIDTDLDVEKDEDETEEDYQESVENKKQEIIDEILGVEYGGE